MRLLIVPICVFALALAAAASALTLGQQSASAITPTPSFTPTATATPTVGPGQTLASFTFTNSSGSPANALDVLALTGYAFYDITALPAGCGAPSHASGPGPGYNSLLGWIPRAAHMFTWPTACAMPGSAATIRFVVDTTQYNYFQQLPHIFLPPTGEFYNSLTATATPTLTPTPTPSTASQILIDCDVTTPGVQSTCTYPAGGPPIGVDIVLRWNEAPTTIGAFNFHVINSDDSVITAPPGADTNLNANPDFNEAGPGAAGSWACGPPTPDNDDAGIDFVTDVPLSADNPFVDASVLVCYTSTIGPAVLPGDMVLARVTYTVGAAGEADITVENLTLGSDLGHEIGSCSPSVVKAITCMGASILVFPPPPWTVTPTPTATSPNSPTPTNTLVGTPTKLPPIIIKRPEGNANNTDEAIPAANLWICVTGPCSGPGEGNLIVFEYAFSVATGDQNGDTIPDGLGAYEFSVEYDNFVIQSVNPSDVVFSPGPIAPYPGGADGVLDGEGAARAPASCGFSLVFENVVHFGCVTAGQTAGPTGDFDLARLNLIPHPDLTNDIFPGNDNGVVTVVKDNGCELVDTFGHPALRSVGGGLTRICGDLAVTVRILEGDMNLDCVVDVQDQQLIAWRYGSFFGSTLYSQWYDLEPNLHDLDIDIKDIQKVFGRDGSTCQEPIQPQPPLPPPAPFGG